MDTLTWIGWGILIIGVNQALTSIAIVVSLNEIIQTLKRIEDGA